MEIRSFTPPPTVDGGVEVEVERLLKLFVVSAVVLIVRVPAEPTAPGLSTAPWAKEVAPFVARVTPPVMMPVPPSVPWVLVPPFTVVRPEPVPDPVVLFTSRVPLETVVVPV
jgi:hypothetical protein